MSQLAELNEFMQSMTEGAGEPSGFAAAYLRQATTATKMRFCGEYLELATCGESLYDFMNLRLGIPPRIQDILDFLGNPVSISARDSTNSWVYDGASIARTVREGIPLSEIELLHEICHWLVAPQYLRSRPEFGLAPGVIDSFAWGPPLDFKSTRKPYGTGTPEDRVLHVNGLVTFDKGEVYELATQMVSIYLGRRFGIPISWGASSPYPDVLDWGGYENRKMIDSWWQNPLSVEATALASEVIYTLS